MLIFKTCDYDLVIILDELALEDWCRVETDWPVGRAADWIGWASWTVSSETSSSTAASV